MAKKKATKSASEPVLVKPKPPGYKFGRPTSYRPELCLEMIEFFDQPLFVKKIQTTINKDGDPYEFETEEVNLLPTFERFALNCGHPPRVLLEWEEKYPDFSKSYAVCRAIQKTFLIQHGLLGNYNSNFAKFVSLNLTDMRDEVSAAVKDLSESLRLKYSIDK